MLIDIVVWVFLFDVYCWVFVVFEVRFVVKLDVDYGKMKGICECLKVKVVGVFIM